MATCSISAISVSPATSPTPIADGYIVAGGLDLNADAVIDVLITGLVTTDLTDNNVII